MTKEEFEALGLTPKKDIVFICYQKPKEKVITGIYIYHADSPNDIICNDEVIPLESIKSMFVIDPSEILSFMRPFFAAFGNAFLRGKL